MDGELEVEHARELPSLLKRNAGLRGIWDCYHLIGDALRGVQGPDLRARICARLDSEPTALAPPRGSVSQPALRIAEREPSPYAPSSAMIA